MVDGEDIDSVYSVGDVRVLLQVLAPGDCMEDAEAVEIGDTLGLVLILRKVIRFGESLRTC